MSQRHEKLANDILEKSTDSCGYYSSEVLRDRIVEALKAESYQAGLKGRIKELAQWSKRMGVDLEAHAYRRLDALHRVRDESIEKNPNGRVLE